MIAPMPIYPMNVGDRVRIGQIAHGLARQHELTLVLPNDGHVDRCRPPAGVHSPCRMIVVPWRPPSLSRQIKSMASSWPYHVALRYRSHLAQTVKRLLAAHPYDLVYCHFLSTLPYAIDSGLPVLWDQHNVDRIYWQHKVDLHRHHYLRHAIMRWNLAKIMRFEAQVLPQIAGVVAVSQTDQALMRQLLPAAVPCFVAPNGVDPAHYVLPTPGPHLPAEPPTLVLGFFGSLDLELNQMAAVVLVQQILPRVRQQLPERRVTLLLLGRNPPTWLRDLVARAPDPAITLTGTVDNVLLYLHQMTMLVLPLQSGAGTKLRVLEAMAAGVCVIGSSFAFMGLDGARPGHHYLLAEEVEQFVQAICQLARNATGRQQMALAARKLVEERYPWQQITHRLAEQLRDTYG